MIKRPYYAIIALVVLALLLGTVFAGNASNYLFNKENNFVGNFYNTIIVALNIDYGKANTQNNYVTLNLDVTGRDVDLDDLDVQFSLDNENWMGYNTSTQRWESKFLGEYQPFYSDFYIGSNGGLKTVYAKVADENGNTGFASAKINFSPESQNPYIESPQSVELNKPESPLAKSGIRGGSGSMYDPYIISSSNTRLIVKVPNATQISYYTDKGAWSSWYNTSNEQADIPITFKNEEGLKEVRLRSKNKYGVEGNPGDLYYLLDSTRPTIKLHTNYHSFTAVNGRLQLDIEANDNLSDILDCEVEVYADGSRIVNKGKIKKYDNDGSTITSVVIEGLPKGKFNVKITVADIAGNKNTRQISIDSI